MRNVMFSVIVPVYNVKEEWLRECLDSVKNQTFPDFEALLIDDGSTDASGAVCDEYAQKDSRFRVFHKENGGVSSARNAGLTQAKGDWILFVDGDDFVSTSALETLSVRLKSSDVDAAYFNICYYEPSGEGWNVGQPSKLTLSDGERFPEDAKKFAILRALSGDGKIMVSGKSYVETFFDFRAVWALTYRKAFLERENLRFCEGLPVGEDMQFNISALTRARNGILYVDSTLYFYRFNPDSQMHRYQPDAVAMKRKMWERINETLGPMVSDKETHDALTEGYILSILEVMTGDMCHPDNPKPRSRRLKDLKAFVRSEPYRTAMRTCRLKNFSWKRQIMILLLRMGWENLLLTLTDIRSPRR